MRNAQSLCYSRESVLFQETQKFILMKRNDGLLLAISVLGILLVLGMVAYPSQPDEAEQEVNQTAPVTRIAVVNSGDGNRCTILTPEAGGTLFEGIVGAPRFLNPLLSDSYVVDRQLVDLIFDGLTRIDENGRFLPALAHDWSISEDGLSVRFRLREGLTWHDGQPVTARDVAFTYGLMQDDNFPGDPALKTLWQSVEINLIDDGTIEFILPEPYSPFLEATTRGILPAHLLEGVTAATLPSSNFHDAPVGTGPFMVDTAVSWQQSGEIRLLPNPTYWGDVPLDAIVWRFYPDEASMLADFELGAIDTMLMVSPEMIPQVTAVPGVQLFTDAAPRQTMLLFNQGYPEQEFPPILSSLALRQALSMAIDRNALIDNVLNGQGLLLDGPFLPSTWAYNPALIPPQPYDLEGAAAKLEEAGWVLSEGGGIRQKDEAALSLRVIALDLPVYRQLVDEITGNWQEVGVTVSTEWAGSMAELQSLLASQQFDVALVDVAPPRDPDQYDFWSQEAIVRGQNYAGWNNRRASESLENARQLWPQDERRPYYNTFLRLFNNDWPALTLYQHVTTTAAHDSLIGFEIGRMFTPRDRYQHLEQWYVSVAETAVACP